MFGETKFFICHLLVRFRCFLLVGDGWRFRCCARGGRLRG
jgi:hypothetical protein